MTLHTTTDEIAIYISLGSNIAPETNLNSAIVTISAKLEHTSASPVYRSAAVGMEGADFLNAVIGGFTKAPLPDVINWLHEIELAHGRVRTQNKFSDRTLDLDLLLYGDSVCNPAESAGIELPHPEITDQAYVLQPLADIAASLVHPTRHCTINSLLLQLQSEHPDKAASLQVVTI